MLKNCYECGQLFTSVGSKLCPDCREAEEVLLRKVKDILIESPGLNILQLSQEAECDPEKIRFFITMGRLTLRSESEMNVEMKCEVCGKQITSGTKCSSCMSQLTQKLKETAESMKKENQPARMGESKESLYKKLNKDDKLDSWRY